MNQFHSLQIRDIRTETSDCISVAFTIPEELAPQFIFKAGQNITLRLIINGTELRRSYSICTSPQEKELRVAIKRVEKGKFSSYVFERIKVGDKLDVLPPTGQFLVIPDPKRSYRYVAFAAGSGITPVIAMIKNILATESASEVTLIYGNRSRSSIIFREELEGLKNRYMERFVMHHVLSREETDAPVHYGRIDEEKCSVFAKSIVDIHHTDQFFICGPEQMIFTVRDWLIKNGVAKEKIHFELFTVPGSPASEKTEMKTQVEGTANVKLKIDGVWLKMQVPFDGDTILDAALNTGADLPYSCKGGVCATCKAKLLSGKVRMDTNYALEQEELDRGFILTCQAHPLSEEIEIDFDDRV